VTLRFFCLIGNFALIIINRMNKPFFYASFSEGNSLSTLEVTSLEEVLQLEQSVYLIVKRGAKERKEYIMVGTRRFELPTY
jgi:hypothetical protein